jgi:hypothetical protein
MPDEGGWRNGFSSCGLMSFSGISFLRNEGTKHFVGHRAVFPCSKAYNPLINNARRFGSGYWPKTDLQHWGKDPTAAELMGSVIKKRRKKIRKHKLKKLRKKMRHRK